MKYLGMVFLILISFQIKAQELFVMTEPASNMPAGSIGIRNTSLLTFNKGGGVNYQDMPEIMWGINRNWMIHATAFMNDKEGDFMFQGGSIYAKYRFFSIDDIHSHFRLAAFGRLSTNNSPIDQEGIETIGLNSGYETGIVATKLVNKTAISSSVSYERALNNNHYEFPNTQSNSAMNYTLSIGQLLHPKKYTSFKQTNINAMVEFLGQRLNGNGKSYLDVVPSVQFIINSQARIDVAYKQELYTTMNRTAPNGFLLRLEYTFFNVTN
ncbi:hypothetical protein [Flavobacterium frigoris]|uniref:MetA-pathway of phenol degradation n=1 Tax=Flavobacterium frigoris (strain PS1) TaxID=1086011 RepID=H7FQA5_FLAFP|nr:hypothetical protein [Flavobacterium frigoris]EIA09459.1 hypothetical protein HJ01_01365 [Flavobacterium frigoris PS1]